MSEPNTFPADRPRTSSAGASHGSAVGSQFFYRYRTADGRTVVVDSLSQVPSSERRRVERIELGPSEPASASERASAFAEHVDWPSFAAGFGLALALATVVLFLARGSLRWVGLLLLIAVLVGGSGAYFGWLRRTTGQSSDAFASPSALINDAQRAVEKLKQRDSEQDRVIRDIQREAK
ncbi:MAG TPA: hypothetical protein VG937_12340 [Polyangiaceae bacterium]|nr:hypothetical protein [Polyangiaceae bacterium]